MPIQSGYPDVLPAFGYHFLGRDTTGTNKTVEFLVDEVRNLFLFPSVVESASFVADAARHGTIRLIQGTSAITVTLSQTAGTKTVIILVKETDQPVTVAVAGAATYRLPGDDDGVTRTASFKLTGTVVLEGSGSSWRVTGATDHDTQLEGNLNANGKQISGNYVVQANATGSMAGAASGRTVFLTGNVTAVPITAGWHQTMRNKSGSNKTITPASGTCIKTKDGTTPASVTLANNKACFVEGDGTNLFVDGDVT
jgi:hypothetical protein